MKEFFTKVLTWIKANMIISIVIALVVVVFFFGKTLKKLFFGTHHKRPRHYALKQVSDTRTLSRRNSRKPLPRSVSMHKAGSGQGYPKYGGGYIPFKRNKDGSIKKAKFVGGTVAAHNYMHSLRKNR